MVDVEVTGGFDKAAWQRAYRATVRGHEAEKKYQTSSKGRRTHKTYEVSEKGRAANKRAMARYRATPEGAARVAALKKTPKAKTTRRSRALKQFYNLTPAEFNNLLAKQNSHCALCTRTAADGRGRSLHVDHDHETGRVRGLLCSGCNRGLGHLGDDEAGLRRALEYVTCPE